MRSSSRAKRGWRTAHENPGNAPRRIAVLRGTRRVWRMMWIGWIIAVAAIAAAIWLARQLTVERALTTQLRFAKIEAENASDAMSANQAQAVGSAGLAPLGKLLGATARELDAPLASVRSQVDHAARQLVDYRTLVKRYDAAVQYCLQPVELIFGADKQHLDKL